MTIETITVPDFGDVQEITVVEVFIAPGDTVAAEDSLISLESEKAVMDIPTPFAGVVKEVTLQEGDSVKSGDVIVLLELTEAGSTPSQQVAAVPEPAPQPEVAIDTPPSGATEIQEVMVPDFGDVQEITVVEVFVAPGDIVAAEDSLISLESEKAVMDIPSPFAGTIKEVRLKEGDGAASGQVIALVEVIENNALTTPVSPPAASETDQPRMEEGKAAASPASAAQAKTPPVNKQEPGQIFHATPSVRAYARELGVDLAQVEATGPKGRIRKKDVQTLVKRALKGETATTGKAALPFAEAPLEDFSAHGPVEDLPLGRIQKISGPHLHRSWVNIPHVTHFDEANITTVEQLRKNLNAEAGPEGIKFSPLVFIIKAVAAALKNFPLFNSSLVAGEKIILKKYYNIAIAVDTPGGLVVPVIKDVDSKGLKEIAGELARLSSAARAGKLTIGDLQGATFTISSLGGIGGTNFTPIVNAPQVAILGLSRSYMKPVWNGEAFSPQLTLPFSVSYDHRVIDGAEAARFCRGLATMIEDLRRTLL